METDDGSSLPIDRPTTPAKPVDSQAFHSHGGGHSLPRVSYTSASALSDGDGTPEYGVGGSSSDSTTLPGVPGLPRANYVIVPEASTPHHTLATAQGLPDLPYFGVVGTLGSGDPIDLYRLTLNAGTVGLKFGLVSDQSASTVPVQLQVFDEWGQMLGEWSSGGQGTTTLLGGLGALPAGSTIYFGISAGNPGGPGATSAGIDYQLWVGLQSATDTAPIAGGAATAVPSSAFLAPIVLPLPAAAALGALPSSGSSQAGPTAPPNGGGELRVAVGSPPMRSARPSDGLLSEGDPAPAVPSDFNAAVNKEWDAPSLAAIAPRTAGEIEPAGPSVRAQESEALVVVNGPGEFPLLGAVAIGHRQGNPAAVAGELATVPGMADQDLLATSRPLPAEAEILMTEGAIAARSRTHRVHPWSGLPTYVYSGLGLATVFTLNAVFSQAIAGFDYLTYRLDAEGRSPARRKDRPRKTGSPPDDSSSPGRRPR